MARVLCLSSTALIAMHLLACSPRAGVSGVGSAGDPFAIRGDAGFSGGPSTPSAGGSAPGPLDAGSRSPSTEGGQRPGPQGAAGAAGPNQTAQGDGGGADAMAPAVHANTSPGRDGGSCITLANDAPEIDETQVTDALPTPQGGEVIQGLYAQTKQVIYGAESNAPTGKRARGTLRIRGNPLDGYTAELTTDERHASGVMSVASTSFTIFPACASEGKLSAGFSTNGATEFRIVQADIGRVDTFTKM
jgi:hypothetical protein